METSCQLKGLGWNGERSQSEDTGEHFGDAQTVRVLVVEDQEVVRLGLKLTIHGVDNMEVIGEADDGPTAVAMASRLRPDVILMDLGLNGFNGIVASKQIKETTDCKILVLTSHCEPQYIYPALEAGVEGYCLKDASKETLVNAIKAVARGEIWLDETVTRKLLGSVHNLNPYTTNSHPGLTNTERNFLLLVLEGRDPRDAAEELGIQMEHVLTYTHQVLKKISTKDNVQDEMASGIRRKITGEHELSRKCSKCFNKVDLTVSICPDDGAACEIDKLIGSRFADRYDLLALLGSGASASVYKARHTFTQKKVAIKILHRGQLEDVELIQRFRQEATAISRLDHKNVISVLDFGITNEGIPFMIMDYVEGVSLSALIEQKGCLQPMDAVEIFKQICSGLEYAHNEGIIHRDLKPGNILVSGLDTGDLKVRIVDFGVAKMNNSLSMASGDCVMTQAGQIFGTPIYMSPEQCRGEKLDRTSDIYAMGILMYETLVGIPPLWGQSPIETMYKQMNAEPGHIKSTKAGENLPVLLQGIVMKALRKDKSKRYQTMAELLTYLGCVPLDESDLAP